MDRYIIRLFSFYLLAGVIVFVMLYLTVDAMSFAARNSDAPTSALVKYYAFHLPSIVYQLMPAACLLATLFCLSNLSKSNELTALFSMGVGLGRVALPILLLVGLVSALVFAIGDQVLPRLVQKRNYVEYVEIKKKPGLYSTVKTNKIWYRSENILFNIKTLNPDGGTAQGITLYYFDPKWELTQLITADQVEMKGSSWSLQNGLVTLFAPESSFPLTQSFKKKMISMNEDMRDVQSTTDSANVMGVKELGRFIQRNREAGLDTLGYEVDYHAKFGFAFAALVMSVVAVPFGVSRARSGGTFVSLGICLALAFSYWVLYSSALTLGKHGLLPPMLAAWGPNGVTLGFSYFLFRRMHQ